MQLRFLGAEYSRQWPTLESQPGEVMGKYRGVVWSATRHTPAVATRQPVTLRFMGRSYEAQV
jgi:hypothetical protein